MDCSQAFEALSRRQWLQCMGAGLGAGALVDLLARDLPAAGDRTYDVSPKKTHHEPRAKAVIQLYMPGGPSHVDMLDPKPMLDKYEGQRYPGVIDVMEPHFAGGIMPSPWKFKKYGQSGIEASSLIPHMAECVDDMTLVRSMYTEHFNHEPAIWMLNSGRALPGRPSIGSWMIYGLGTENQNLPAYVVLDDPNGMPIDGIRNWSSGWLPPVYQGTRFRSHGEPIPNLKPSRPVSDTVQKGRRELLDTLAARHRAERPGEADLDARIASYALAARMQISATDALDLSQETEETHKLYGLDDKVAESYGRRCLMARRLVERGVRFVQIYMEAAVWDDHYKIRTGHPKHCARIDRPIAGLMKDLKQRGLLEDTLVIWAGEFGRLPIVQSSGGAAGRDHNRYGFTVWMAGGGLKRGFVYGATDEFGVKAVENPVGVPDLHATILHVLGLDYQRLTYNVHGLDEGLIATIYKPRVVHELFA
jgi:hypothetical protein